MGIGIVLGSCAIGVIIVKNSVECMIARQYLCQASCFMLSVTLLAFTALDDYLDDICCFYGFMVSFMEAINTRLKCLFMKK
jgi:hypothetical protein